MEKQVADRDNILQNLEEYRNRIRHIDDQIKALEDQHGTLNVEENQKLKQQKKELETYHQNKKKQLIQIQNAAKQSEKIQEDIGVVVSSLIKGLKAVAKGVGNGLQELGKKNRLHSSRPAGHDRELCISHGRSGYFISW